MGVVAKLFGKDWSLWTLNATRTKARPFLLGYLTIWSYSGYRFNAFQPCVKWANRMQARQKRVVRVRRGVHVGVSARLLRKYKSPWPQRLLRDGLDVSHFVFSRPVVVRTVTRPATAQLDSLCLRACALILLKPIPYVKTGSYEPSVICYNSLGLAIFFFAGILSLHSTGNRTEIIKSK